jgi:transcriptional regulator with XRE-family HTH domain
MNRIHDVLKEKGMKQIQLAEALGVAKSSVSQWCSNAVQPPLSRLILISNVIGCDVIDLIVTKK